VAAVLDIILSWKARRSMSLAVKLRFILKLISAAAWVVILPVTYAYSWENPSVLSHVIKSWLGNGQNQQSLYILALVVYLAPNILASVLFLFPSIRRLLERSDKSIMTFMMWWAQVILCDIGKIGVVITAIPEALTRILDNLTYMPNVMMLRLFELL
jgi:callose synthase